MIKDNFRRLLLHNDKPHVLVLGDVMLDKFIWGSVDRISPEAPVQIVNIQRENTALGGAANVAHNLAAIDCRVTILGVVGRDENGRTIGKKFDDYGIKKTGLFIDGTRPTTTKTRVIAGSQQVVRIDHETAGPVPAAIETQILAFLKKNIAKFNALIISDYQKGVLTDKIIRGAIRLSRKAGIKTIVDPKRKDFSIYAGSSLIKPNLKEAEAAVGRRLQTEKEVRDAASLLLEKHGFGGVLITRGKDGMFLLEKNYEVNVPATTREVFDVTGAGDTVLAYLGYLIAAGHSFSEATKVANIAAGIAVSHVGTVTVSKDEVLHQLDKTTSGAKKILSMTELNKILPAIRQNSKIVFTNGCFDILHVGHIALFRKAKAFGDKLIIGVNTDASIRRIKGKKRPIVSEQERAHILSALEPVDFVVLFDEDTPIKLIKAVKPDILVKGSDYTVDKVIGHDIVTAYGGKVELVDLIVGFSTTNIVDSILKNYSAERSSAKRPKSKSVIRKITKQN
ncbi:D-glycero-beta-D-manno-heptose-7-phosphate kinase [bacterium]|nr:D-glycero-beta-D-manno-heptose-7-phosphate kinase [bacterium]